MHKQKTLNAQNKCARLVETWIKMFRKKAWSNKSIKEEGND